METIINTQSQSSRFDFSRSIAFSLLGKLSDCGLLIEEPSARFFFGDRSAVLQAHIKVHDSRMYKKLLLGGSIGAGESFVEGDWSSDNLVNVIRVFARNLKTLDKLERRLGWISLPFQKLRHLRNRNSLKGSRTNIAAHYDLGNDLYRLILDENMQYSSAIYDGISDSLHDAQQNKLRIICERLELSEKDHLLEIGTGWGGLACFAAKNYGCQVTTTTLSQQQYDYTRELIETDGLGDKINLLLSDYRELDGQYSKLVSVEMIEAVGHEYMPHFFRQLENLLTPGGRLLIQAITIADDNYEQYRKGVDFIQQYIFPGGCLPSVSQMQRNLDQYTSMEAISIDDYALDYAQTIASWSMNFNQQSQQLSRLGYEEDFQRLWHFYFAYCEGGFREKTIGLAHFLAIKPDV